MDIKFLSKYKENKTTRSKVIYMDGAIILGDIDSGCKKSDLDIEDIDGIFIDGKYGTIIWEDDESEE